MEIADAVAKLGALFPVAMSSGIVQQAGGMVLSDFDLDAMALSRHHEHFSIVHNSTIPEPFHIPESLQVPESCRRLSAAAS